MTSYLICRKICREPTLALATASPCVWLTNTHVGNYGGWYLYNTAIIKAGFVLLTYRVKTNHCSAVSVSPGQNTDDPTFKETIPFSSFKIRLNQYRPSGSNWVATGMSKVCDLSEQGMDGEYLWAFLDPTSASVTPIVFDYAAHIGKTLTLPSEFLEGKRLSGPDVSFVIDHYNESRDLRALPGANIGSQMDLEYV